MSRPIIEFIDVVKEFGVQRILDHVSVGFPEGKTTVIAGGSGQGKSVSLKLILGLMKPESGRILVDGHDITSMNRRQLNRIRTNFGVLFQGSALLDSITVFENVALPLRERSSFSRQEIHRRVEEMLSQFDLTGHGGKFPAQLSGGMKKRVGLSRALMLHPKIMLFDEPTTGLDPEISMEIYRLFFKTQKKYGYTSIIVSHDIPKVFNLADQVILLKDSKMLTFDSPEEIQYTENSEIQSFVETTMGQVYISQDMEKV